jgi:CheY-like chemotaxis protein
MNYSIEAPDVLIQINESPNPALLQKEIHISCILLVDDDRATNFLNKRLLEKMGVTDTIKIARNGVEAMDYLVRAAEGERDFPVPDLIFLDLNMPMVNGWEFLERYNLLPDDFKQSISLHLLTTSLRQDDFEQANRLEIIKGFLYKPLTAEQVLKAMEENFC